MKSALRSSIKSNEKIRFTSFIWLVTFTSGSINICEETYKTNNDKNEKDDIE